MELCTTVKNTTPTQEIHALQLDIDGEKLCGQIMFYVKVYPICYCTSAADCTCSPVFLALLKKISCDNVCAFKKHSTDLVQAKLTHIFTGKITTAYTAVKIDRIIGLGVFITFADEGDEKVCVSLRPNQVESDWNQS